MVDEDGGLAAQLELSPVEVVTLHALQLQMMRTDVRAERKDKVSQAKSELLAKRRDQFLVAMQSVDDNAPVNELKSAGAAERLAGRIDGRSRGMILLIELMTFNPWHPEHNWVASARKEALKTAADELKGISWDDLAAATKEYDALLKQLRRKSIKWGAVAAVTVVGMGVGALTAGLAAPMIGAAIGASMGLSGAAATSAGLAALGGGSLASGGFGVFGGTILLTGVGGVLAGGTAGTSSRYSPIGTGLVVADAIKLDLLAKLVLADAPDRDQKLRRVAEGLQSRINEFSDKINLLSERIVTLKAQLNAVTEENRALSGENEELKDELAKLKAERADAQGAKTTLEVVLTRIGGSAPESHTQIDIVNGDSVSLTQQIPNGSVVLIERAAVYRAGSPRDPVIDMSALVCGADEKVLSDSHFVFYNNTATPDGAVKRINDENPSPEGEREVISVDLAAVPKDVNHIAIGVSTSDEDEHNQNFASLEQLHIRVVDQETGDELVRYDVPVKVSDATGLIAGALCRQDDEWTFRAISRPYESGLRGMAVAYGVDVD